MKAVIVNQREHQAADYLTKIGFVDPFKLSARPGRKNGPDTCEPPALPTPGDWDRWELILRPVNGAASSFSIITRPIQVPSSLSRRTSISSRPNEARRDRTDGRNETPPAVARAF